jgi:hypothetical protein
MTSSARSSVEQLATRLAGQARGAAAALRGRLPELGLVAPALLARWLDVGERVAAQAPEATCAWAESDPEQLERLDEETLAGFVTLVRETAAHAPALATALARGTWALLGRVPGPGIAAAVQEAFAIFAEGGWRAERRAQLFLEASAGLGILHPGLLDRWHRLAPRLARQLDETQFFAALPATVGPWSEDEQRAWLELVHALAERAPAVAAVVYRDLPASLAPAAPGLRRAVVVALATASPELDAAEFGRTLPVLGALVASVPRPAQAVVCETLGDVAVRCPRALPGLLRVLPRLADLASAERLAAWRSRGLALAAETPEAAMSYFALASRTSMQVLQDSPTAAVLDELQGELRRFVQMLSADPAVPHPVDGIRLRLPFEDDAAAHGIALPALVDLFDSFEDNARLLRLLAALTAGRREFGTYARSDVPARLRAEGEPPALEELVLLTDGYRVTCRLAARYPGLAADLAWAAPRLLARAAPTAAPHLQLDALLALAVGGEGGQAEAPFWLRAAASLVLPALRPLAEPEATLEDAVAVARELARFFTPPPDAGAGDAAFADLLPLLLDEYGGEGIATDGPLVAGAGDDGDDAPAAPLDLPEDLALALGESLGELPDAAGLSPDELRRLLEAGVELEMSQGRGQLCRQLGLFVTQLMGKRLADRATLATLDPHGVGAALGLRAPHREHATAVYLYDEWDHLIGDYRRDWCRVREIAVAEDAGVFYERTLARHAELVPEIRRHFQLVRPEAYRTLRGLEDGEDFDLGAVVDARAQLRARRTPSAKLYTKRVRQERDVATLFLVDLSASTDESAPGAADGTRIIDITREALALMAAALDEIGDAFAIYGFSGQGRDNVEFFPVKSFDERLTPAVKGRIGGLAPRGSTRMGAALRHAITKLRGVTAPSRHLVLLSDGFPQDLDYGQDRQSHAYGIRDTATALRETQAAGIRPFCITVDAAGHDYLRDMCDPHSYLVIDRVADLPRELPKIYQRLVWAG